MEVWNGFLVVLAGVVAGALFFFSLWKHETVLRERALEDYVKLTKARNTVRVTDLQRIHEILSKSPELAERVINEHARLLCSYPLATNYTVECEDVFHGQFIGWRTTFRSVLEHIRTKGDRGCALISLSEEQLAWYRKLVEVTAFDSSNRDESDLKSSKFD